MKCVICKMAETAEGLTTVTLMRGDSTILVKSVPAEICLNCGEYYLSDAVGAQIMKLAENAIQLHSEIAVIPYAA